METNRPYDRPQPNKDSLLSMAPSWLPSTIVIVVIIRGCSGIRNCFHLYDLLLAWPVRQWLGFIFSCFHNCVWKENTFFQVFSLLDLLYPLIAESWHPDCVSNINYPSLLNKKKLSPDVVFCYGAEMAAACKNTKYCSCHSKW